MRRLALLAGVLVCAAAVRAEETNWPQFRGPGGSGLAEGFPLPATWGGETGENVLWKAAVPGLAHASPVIWGDGIFLVTAVGENEKAAELKVGLYGSVGSVENEGAHAWRILGLDKKTGAVRWDLLAHTGTPKVKRHPKSSHANAAPAVDGKHLVAWFGSEGLVCTDLDGNLLWKKDLGVMNWAWFEMPEAEWGGGSSPVIHGDAVILQCDVLGEPFLAALALEDGTERWRTKRDDVPTWSTPLVLAVGDAFQVVVNGFKHMGGYDAATGEELWRLSGGGDIPVPTPVAAHGLVYLTGAHGRLSPILAVRPQARGDVTLEGEQTSSDAVAWSIRRGGNYMQTPIVAGDLLFACRDAGILSCFDARTGEKKFQQKLGDRGEGFTASPVGGDGKLYFASEKGRVFVVRSAPDFELLAVNDMGEPVMATPALSAGVLFLRTRSALVAVAAAK